MTYGTRKLRVKFQLKIAAVAMVGMFGAVSHMVLMRKSLSSVSSYLMSGYHVNEHRMTLATGSISEIGIDMDLMASKYISEDKDFDPAEITHVYHIGHGRPFGRSNNQIISILHAIDIALDNHGDLPKNHAVVALSKWAYEIVKGIFYNGSNTTEFPILLEQLRPALLLHEDRLEDLGLSESNNKTQIYLSAKDAYYYVKKNRKRLTPQIIRKRRQAVLGTLFQHGVAERNLVLYNVVKDHINANSRLFGNNKNNKLEYVTIHSRWLEGECERRVGRFLPKDECWMTPSYIKSIMGGTIDKPIVIIGDGQKKEIIEKLALDPDIGPALIIPQEILPENVEIAGSTQPWSDMMVAIMSDIFIGTRASSFATIVGLFRVVRGADPASNFIYTSQENSTLNQGSDIEICEDCLFLCDKGEQNFATKFLTTLVVDSR